MVECCICLEPTSFKYTGNRHIKPRTSNDVILKCNHIYHRTCIKKWFVEQDACPYCRSSLEFREGSYYKMLILFAFYRVKCEHVDYWMYIVKYIFHDITMHDYIQHILTNNAHFTCINIMYLKGIILAIL